MASTLKSSLFVYYIYDFVYFHPAFSPSQLSSAAFIQQSQSCYWAQYNRSESIFAVWSGDCDIPWNNQSQDSQAGIPSANGMIMTSTTICKLLIIVAHADARVQQDPALKHGEDLIIQQASMEHDPTAASDSESGHGNAAYIWCRLQVRATNEKTQLEDLKRWRSLEEEVIHLQIC